MTRTTGSAREYRATTWISPAPATRDRRNPAALRLISDSLRYWVERFHVDGFRFDLATTLAREDDGFDPRGGFFDIVHQDPVLAQVKLIAEPWDLGEGGYQVGRFPAGWSNGTAATATRCARTGGATAASSARWHHGSSGSQRPVRGAVDASPRERQLHHRARRLHAARPCHLQRQAQRSQRRQQRRRRDAQRQLELRRRGPDFRPGDHRAARTAERNCWRR